jgi:P-type Ca2+ transporter type 2C
LIMIGLLSVGVGVIGIASGYELVEMIKLSVSIAVSAIPEGLAITLTVILAIGMQRILRKNALVRKLVAAETLGSVNVICTDKTGTLTTGKLEMISKVSHRDEIMKLAASLMQSTTDPLEVALKEWIEKQRFHSKETLVKELPFSPDRKFSIKQTEHYQIIVGAPEIILKRTRLRGKDKEHDHMEVFTKKGYRLVGVAYRHHQSKSASVSGIEGVAFTWAGFYVFSDPPRTGLKSVFEQLKKAGIAVKVITGDHANTAQAILAQIGIKVKEEEIVYGHEFKTLSASQLESRVLEAKLFARTNPDQKLEIVNILQASGKVVAMTGDGVNDAPALKQADIGIVVSGASDVSKETADMVLLDDNFATIISAIEEGRGMFDSLQKVLIYLLSNAFTETVVVITSLLLKLPLPFTPIQLLWVNLATDTLPAMALTMDQKRRGMMDQPPRSLSAGLLNRSVVAFIVVAATVSSLIMNGVMIGFSKMLGTAYSETFLFTLLSMMTLAMIFTARAGWQPLYKYRHPTNWILLGALALGVMLQAAVIYVPFLQRIFGTTALELKDWGLIILLCAGLLVMTELSKLVKDFYVRRRSYRSHPTYPTAATRGAIRRVPTARN